jgi:hypothetical protein
MTKREMEQQLRENIKAESNVTINVQSTQRLIDIFYAILSQTRANVHVLPSRMLTKTIHSSIKEPFKCSGHLFKDVETIVKEFDKYQHVFIYLVYPTWINGKTQADIVVEFAALEFVNNFYDEEVIPARRIRLRKTKILEQ